MDRLIAANSVNFAGRDVAPLTGTKQYATNGNPGAGIPGTIWPAYQYNAIQEELLAVIAAAGIAFDNTNNAQLLAALQGLGSYSISFSASRFRIPGTPVLVQQVTGTVTVAGGSGVNVPAGLYWQSLGSISWPVSFPNACLWAGASANSVTDNYIFNIVGTRNAASWGGCYAVFNQLTNNIPYTALSVGY